MLSALYALVVSNNPDTEARALGLLALIFLRHEVVLVGHLGVPALAGDPCCCNIHFAPVSFTLLLEAVGSDVHEA